LDYFFQFLWNKRIIMPWFCEHPDCKRQANFVVKGNKAVFCKEHKCEDMLNITKKYCEHTDCTRHAQYGYSKNKPLFCNEHKLRECFMHITNTVDLISAWKCHVLDTKWVVKLFTVQSIDWKIWLTSKRSTVYI
jgi:hypothetical protein